MCPIFPVHLLSPFAFAQGVPKAFVQKITEIKNENERENLTFIDSEAILCVYFIHIRSTHNSMFIHDEALHFEYKYESKPFEQISNKSSFR